MWVAFSIDKKFGIYSFVRIKRNISETNCCDENTFCCTMSKIEGFHMISIYIEKAPLSPSPETLRLLVIA